MWERARERERERERERFGPTCTAVLPRASCVNVPHVRKWHSVNPRVRASSVLHDWCEHKRKTCFYIVSMEHKEIFIPSSINLANNGVFLSNVFFFGKKIPFYLLFAKLKANACSNVSEMVRNELKKGNLIKKDKKKIKKKEKKNKKIYI